MKLLVDNEIKDLLDSSFPIIENFHKPADWYSMNSLVQPSSLDLHIGDIYIPDKKKPVVNGDKYSLPPGSTVVVETREVINLPSNISAFGFPPNQISADGILMTNPGHIDPGYKGKISFTLINMSKKSFSLKKDDIIVTLLLVKLEDDCHKDYQKRKDNSRQNIVRQASSNSQVPLVPKQLDLLTYDFLNVERRAKKIANERVASISIIAVIIIGLAPIVTNMITGLNSRVGDLESRLKIIENNRSIDTLKASVSEIKIAVGSLQKNSKFGSKKKHEDLPR